MHPAVHTKLNLHVHPAVHTKLNCLTRPSALCTMCPCIASHAHPAKHNGLCEPTATCRGLALLCQNFYNTSVQLWLPLQLSLFAFCTRSACHTRMSGLDAPKYAFFPMQHAAVYSACPLHVYICGNMHLRHGWSTICELSDAKLRPLVVLV